MADWDIRFLQLAHHVSLWSRDPSTRCGAVIVRPDKSICSVGFNGFPKGVDDDPKLYEDREKKYARIIHCEINAMLFAREPLHGYTLYTWPFLTCHRCAVQVIQSGITKVVTVACPPEKEKRWEESLAISRELYMQAGVNIVTYANSEELICSYPSIELATQAR